MWTNFFGYVIHTVMQSPFDLLFDILTEKFPLEKIFTDEEIKQLEEEKRQMLGTEEKA